VVRIAAAARAGATEAAGVIGGVARTWTVKAITATATIAPIAPIAEVARAAHRSCE
jgi:hypothetical protein